MSREVGNQLEWGNNNRSMRLLFLFDLREKYKHYYEKITYIKECIIMKKEDINNKKTNEDWWIFENKKTKEEKEKEKKKTKSKEGWWIFE